MYCVIKSKEALEAQARAWVNEYPIVWNADRTPAEQSIQSQLIQRIGDYATELYAGHDVPPISGYGDHARQTTVTFTRDTYIAKLRALHGDPEAHADIAYTAQMLAAYPAFEPAIQDVLDHQDGRYVGHGDTATVYALRNQNKPTVVKVGGVYYHDMRAHRIGMKHPRLSHALAASLAERRMVMDQVPGSDMDKVPGQDRRHITAEQLGEAVDQIYAMYQDGLRLDIGARPENLRYDVRDGFFFIDYHFRNPLVPDRPQELALQLLVFMSMLLDRGDNDPIEQLEYGSRDYANLMEQSTHEDVHVLGALLDALEQRPDVLRHLVGYQQQINSQEQRHLRRSVILSRELPARIPPWAQVRRDLAAFNKRLKRLGLSGEA